MKALAVVLLVLGTTPLWATGDEVFADAVDRAPSAVADPQPTLRWQGETNVEAGVLGWPLSGGALATTTLTVGGSAGPGLLAHTELTVTEPANPVLTVPNLWVEVSPAAGFRFALGRQNVSWELGRVLTAVDLADATPDALTLRSRWANATWSVDTLVSAPLPSSATGWSSTSVGSSDSLASLDTVTGAAQVQWSSGPLALGLMARQSTLTEAGLTGRFSLGGWDGFAEGLVQHQFQKPGYQSSGLAGVFHGDETWQLYAEVSADYRRATTDPSVQAVAALRRLAVLVPSGQVGLEYRQTLTTNAARLTPGMAFDLVPGCRLALGLPVNMTWGQSPTVQAGARVEARASY